MFRKGLEHLSNPYKYIVENLLNALQEVFGQALVSVIVFGSVARGDPRKDSDLDILIIVEDLPKPHFERLNLYMKAEEKLDPLLYELYEKGYAISISPILKTKREAEKITPLYLDMTEDAVIIYDKENFFERILTHLIEKMKELGSRRIWIGKKWYWILKDNTRFGEVIEIE